MLTRRGFVKLVGGAVAMVSLPLGCGDNLAPTVNGRFFDADAWRTIEAATEVLLPGARDAQAVRYIDTLLSAFDVDPPAIFAGGPFSGRTPFPDAHGAPSTELPDNAFAAFTPLSRVQEIAWRMRIYGSAATPGAAFNDAVLGETVGWRDAYTAGIARLDAVAAEIAGTTYRALAAADQQAALDRVASDQPAFYQALLAHTIEGTFAAPEYGGNAALAGWQAARWDGDSAPLGHAVYDATIDAYVDRVDQPTSTATPGDAREAFDDDVIALLTVASVGSGGKRFF